MAASTASHRAPIYVIIERREFGSPPRDFSTEWRANERAWNISAADLAALRIVLGRMFLLRLHSRCGTIGHAESHAHFTVIDG